ncbi:MAG: hypothetical protein ACREL7_02875 [Longimicrobiales bacterium]
MSIADVREPELSRPGLESIDADRDDSFLIGIRERTQENRVDYGEDRGVRADADGEREDDDESEAGRLGQ